ncbi:hypothetical protein DR64_3561 [Paraburkholderia xenovorans LB400]|nr:hypothetical protein DR64_3561 [Paraburkholderia xenovorans LB400]
MDLMRRQVALQHAKLFERVFAEWHQAKPDMAGRQARIRRSPFVFSLESCTRAASFHKIGL